jgi:hypothetical protein
MDPRDVDLSALLKDADTPAHDAGGLARLLRRCWPDHSDETLPAARDWVRRWRPASLTAQPAVCRCSQGRCLWCN